MCTLISLVLWFTLSMRETYTATFELPTQIVNLPEGQALTELPPKTVRVEVQGEGFQLLKLEYDRPVVPINAQEREISLESVPLDLPNDVQVRSVTPRSFSLEKERRISKKIPVRLQAQITPAPPNDLLQEPRLTPDSIIVSGARSIVQNLDYWPTEYVEYEGLRDSLVARIPLADTLEGLVRKSHIATTLTAVARPFTEGTRVIPVDVTGVATNQKVVSLVPSSVRVTYRVPLSQYELAQTAPDFFATVSYNDIRIDTTGRVRPQLHLPADLILRNVEMHPPTLGYYERLVEQ